MVQHVKTSSYFFSLAFLHFLFLNPTPAHAGYARLSIMNERRSKESREMAQPDIPVPVSAEVEARLREKDVDVQAMRGLCDAQRNCCNSALIRWVIGQR
jgi:hypothetical protein